MKVVERIFEHRIRQQIKIDDMQFGFMKGKGTGVRTYKRGTVNRGTVKRGQLIAGQLIARTHNRSDN